MAQLLGDALPVEGWCRICPLASILHWYLNPYLQHKRSPIQLLPWPNVAWLQCSDLNWWIQQEPLAKLCNLKTFFSNIFEKYLCIVSKIHFPNFTLSFKARGLQRRKSSWRERLDVKRKTRPKLVQEFKKVKRTFWNFRICLVRQKFRQNVQQEKKQDKITKSSYQGRS